MPIRAERGIKDLIVYSKYTILLNGSIKMTMSSLSTFPVIYSLYNIKPYIIPIGSGPSYLPEKY